MLVKLYKIKILLLPCGTQEADRKLKTKKFFFQISGK